MSKLGKIIAWVFAGILTIGGIIIVTFRASSIIDPKKILNKQAAANNDLPQANPVVNPTSVISSANTSSYVTLSGVPVKYKRLLAAGDTAFTIPSGSIEYSWEVISGEAVIDDVTLPAGTSDMQEYVTGLTYGAIAITGVTGEVLIKYKKPA